MNRTIYLETLLIGATYSEMTSTLGLGISARFIHSISSGIFFSWEDLKEDQEIKRWYNVGLYYYQANFFPDLKSNFLGLSISNIGPKSPYNSASDLDYFPN